MSRGVALSGGLLVTLATPATWPLALAAFLIRGGIVLVVLPIVVLPTPVGLGNAFGPTLTAIALGQLPLEARRRRGSSRSAVVLRLAVRRRLAGGRARGRGRPDRRVDEDVDRRAGGRSGRGGAPAPAAVGSPAGSSPPGSIAIIPLAARPGVGVGPPRPRDLSRADQPDRRRRRRSSCGSCAATPEVVAAIVARLDGRRDRRGRRGAADRAGRRRRRPGAASAAVGDVPAASALGARPVLAPDARPARRRRRSAVGAGRGLVGRRRRPRRRRDDPVRVLVSVVALVFLWVVGLLLASVVCAWRAAVWTVAEVVRQGTFGGSTDRRPGDWRPEGSSATL